MPAPRGVAAVLFSVLLSLGLLSAAAQPGNAVTPVAWPISNGALLAEVVTGGASASDEYIEIYNAAPGAVDLGDCELIYVTTTGATTSRKAAFAAPFTLAPGRHLLVANAAGIYGALADATYTGGLAADGGSLALRRIGGSVIDAVGWGTAANTYVEGVAAAAPPARSSLERRPGGADGNAFDTNDNASDWLVQVSPVPQSLASPPTPGPTPTPSPTATPMPTPLSTISTPAPSAAPSEVPSAVPTSGGTSPATSEPSDTASASPSTGPSETPAATATPTAPPSATPAPTAAPTATPAPVDPYGLLTPIASVRVQPVGGRVHLAGVVTAAPGFTGDASLMAVADQTGGIFVRLPIATSGFAPGTSVELAGVLAAPYGQLEVREIARIVAGGVDELPLPITATIAEIAESLEGSVVAVSGKIDSVQVDGGRIVVALGDGGSSLRVMIDPATGITKSDVVRGDSVALTGVVGQRATASGKLDGYRLWLRIPDDLTVIPPAPASPSAPPPGSTPTPRPAAPTPSATPVYHDLATGLAVRGRLVDVQATVTATAGIIDWGGPTIVVDDGTAAVAVVLPGGAAGPRIGARVRVAGKVGSLNNGRRVVATALESLGEIRAVEPREVSGSLVAANEWQLVRLCGRIDKVTHVGLRWRADLTVDGHAVTVLGEPASGIPAAGLSKGRLALVTGIVRRSTSDTSQFVLLPRAAVDLRLGPAPAASGGSAMAAIAGSGAAGSGAGGDPAIRPVSAAELPDRAGQTVIVAGLVVDATEENATIDDGTGRIRLGGDSASAELSLLEPGDAIEATGIVAGDEEGWLVVVDPDRLVVLAGAGQDAAVAADATSPAPIAAVPAAAAADESAPAATRLNDANTLARSTSVGSPGPGAAGTVFGVLGLALLAFLGLVATLLATGRARFLQPAAVRAPMGRTRGMLRDLRRRRSPSEESIPVAEEPDSAFLEGR